MTMLSESEMKAIKTVLVDGGGSVVSVELGLMYDLLATLRSELRCSNHDLHKLYSEQLKGGTK